MKNDGTRRKARQIGSLGSLSVGWFVWMTSVASVGNERRADINSGVVSLVLKRLACKLRREQGIGSFSTRFLHYGLVDLQSK